MYRRPDSDSGDRRDTEESDDQLRAADPKLADADTRRDIRPRRPVLGAGNEGDRVPHEEREPEREEQQLELPDALAANRPPKTELQHEPERGGRDDAEDDGKRERHVQRVAQDQHVRAECEELAVREVDEPEHAEDERQPDRAEREVVARDNAVDRCLGDLPPALHEPEDDADGDEAPTQRRQRVVPERVEETSSVQSSLALDRGNLL